MKCRQIILASLVLACVLICGESPLLAGLGPAPGPDTFASDDAFLEYVEHQTFNYFLAESYTNTGLIRDRSEPWSTCSVAAQGFGLSALDIGVDRGWITREEGRTRVLTALQNLYTAPQGPGPSGYAGYHGWFYHFIDMTNRARAYTVELSTIDTALLMMGVMDVGLFFDDPTNAVESSIRQLSDALLNRLDWPFVLRSSDHQVVMQWTPESGYSSGGWLGYSEASCLYLLGLGAATNPLPASSWSAWTNGYQWSTAYGPGYVTCPPLFTHHYSQCWIDFRSIADGYFRAAGSDYFENSRRATLAQHQYALQNPLGFPGYGAREWGFTACDGPNRTVNGVFYQGYTARGVPGGFDDGTIAPTAALGSLPFAPEICLPTVRHLYDAYRTNLWTAEGFRDAYNLLAQWWGEDTVGIDEGAIVLMIENYRTGSVWKRLLRSPILQRGLQRAGFTAPPPDQITATVVSPTEIDVAWTGPTTYQTGFQVQTATDAVHFSPAAEVGSNVFNVALTLTPNTTYYIRVVTICSAGLSGARLTVQATTPPAGPFPATLLTASDATATSSFAAAGNWSDAAVPTSNRDYQVNGVAGGAGFTLRTPADVLSHTFAGNSLTLGDGAVHSPVNTLFYAGTNSTCTINDLKLNGGKITQGTPGSTFILAGNVTLQEAGGFLEQGAFNNRNLIVTAAIRGGGPLTVNQLAQGNVSAVAGVDGCVELAGANTYTGPTIVAGSALYPDLITRVGPATLRIHDLQNGGQFSNVGQSSSAATNLLLQAATLQYRGPGATSDRLFSVGLPGATLDASGSGTLNLTNPGAMGLAGAGSRTLILIGTNLGHNILAAAVGDGGGATAIIKTNSGTWVLAGTNTYTGGTSIGGGTLVATGKSALGAGGMTILAAGSLVLSNASVDRPLQASGGALKFSGRNFTNTLSGQITLLAGSVNINCQTGVGANDARLVISGGVVGANKNLEIFDDVNNDPGNVWIVSHPINLGTGELQGFGSHVAVAGNVVGTIHPYYGRRITLETDNAFSGTPALRLGNPSWGRLDLNGHSLVIGSLVNSTSNDEITSAGPATLTVTTPAAQNYSGVLTGAGLALTKTGTGTLTLTAPNTYRGNTIVSQGTLSLSSAAGPTSLLSNTPSINLGKNAKLDVSGLTSGFALASGQTLLGNGTVMGAVTLRSGATLAPGDAAVASFGALTVAPTLDLQPGCTTLVHVASSPATNDLTTALERLTLSGTLVVSNAGAVALADGDVFRLFNSTNILGAFDRIIPARPGPGLAWDTSLLNSSGILRAVNIIPRINLLSWQENGLALGGAGGLGNAPYYVLSATNVAVPLGQWSRVATDAFSASGEFSISNVPDSNSPSRFFRLLVP